MTTIAQPVIFSRPEHLATESQAWKPLQLVPVLVNLFPLRRVQVFLFAIFNGLLITLLAAI
jgi:hypothetical protein